MRITQSTSVGGLNPDWLIDCEAREMAGSSCPSKRQERCLTYGEKTACNDSCKAPFEIRAFSKESSAL